MKEQYFKEYYSGNKFIGKLPCVKDRETLGYAGKKDHVARESFKVGKRTIKRGDSYTTILYKMGRSS